MSMIIDLVPEVASWLAEASPTPTPAPTGGSGAPAAPKNDATTQILIAALGAGGLGAILAAIVTGLFSKRKLGAEATEIITKAATGVVERLEAELERRADDMEAMKTAHVAALVVQADEHAKEREEWRRVLQLHVAWDAIAIAKLGDIGIDLPPAPPLLPPVDRRTSNP